ncbi:MAG: YicC/YloC family endoribonuclease [Thermodesulfobacteriota bacterium]
MLRSMTGFGRGESARADRKVTVEIKCVNNRYRDIVVRLPKALQPLEEEIRGQAASRLRRGRIEIVIQIERGNGQIDGTLDLNLPLARAYHRIIRRLSDELGLERGISAEELCQMKDVLSYKPEEVDVQEMRAALGAALAEALDTCDAMRLREGRAIEEDLSGRLRLIEEHLDWTGERAPRVVEEYRKKLRERAHQVLNGRDIDESRLAQEVVLFAERCDITEEVVRARSHLGQFRSSMRPDEAVGRKLDFLVQEIHREVNTLSNKALDASISARAVEMKAELEKVREQVQNVE